MNTLTRQQKRAMMRTIEKNRGQWIVPGWQPMRFIRKEVDSLDPNGDQVIFQNNLYIAVVRRKSDGIIHISLRNMDNSTEIPWTHKQQIKNDICGKEREAIELFPAMSRIVDTANQYHLWVYPEGYVIPTGFPKE